MADDVSFFDLFDPSQPRSDKEVIEQRLEICKVCPAFRPKSQTCSKCGCFMQLKATLTLAKCPIGKW
jgi:uncharacterized paraquat-inducible protein A